jgi:hypothetical protein
LDNQNFIESGLLESYLLGLTTEEEKKYVDQALQTDHQAADYIYELEENIQKYFDQNSIPPPPQLREVILFRTTKTDIQKKKHVFRETSNEDTSKKSEYLDIEVNDTYIKVHKYWRPAFIAVFALSKIFLIAGLYYYFKTTSLEQEILKLKTEIQQVK